jgi:deoxyribodipyrimidine photolyase-related protein
MYKSLDRMSDEKRQAIQDDSHRFFTAIDANEKV